MPIGEKGNTKEQTWRLPATFKVFVVVTCTLVNPAVQLVFDDIKKEPVVLV